MANRLEAHIGGSAASWRAAIERSLAASARILIAGDGVARISGHTAAPLDAAIARGGSARAVVITGALCARISVGAILVILDACAITAIEAASALGRIVLTDVTDAALATRTFRI